MSAFDYTCIVPQKEELKKRQPANSSKRYRMVQNENIKSLLLPTPSASKNKTKQKPSALASWVAFRGGEKNTVL